MKPSITLALGAAVLGMAAVSVLTVSSSHAGSARPGSGVSPGSDRNACFDPDFIQGYQTIDNHTVVVTSHRNEAYELTLSGVCLGLESSFQVGIRSRHGGDVCGPFDADIVWSDNQGGLQSCRVSTMRHLQGDEAAPYVESRKPRDTAASQPSR